ncbi:DUF2029 domain-containing protein [bacterium]|nr:DUF2029 domain-containing protein [bacterium]
MFRDKTLTTSSKVLLVIFFSVTFFALTVAISQTPAHDYISYMDQWDVVLQGLNPWSNDMNAYGPIFNVLALLYSAGWYLPRLLFASLWLISGLLIANFAEKNPEMPEIYKYILFVLLFFNPLFWIFVVRYGTNDIFMAFFMLLSFLLYRKERDIPAGILLAVAIGYKFIPIFMLPFLVFSKVRVRWRFAFTVGVSLLIIFGGSYWLWGDGTFYPFLFGAERGSKMLSIFRFLRGHLSPLRIFTHTPDLDWMSMYITIIALLLFFISHIKRNYENIFSSIIALGIVFTLYKVGHHQFYITLTLLLAFWISTDFKKIMDAEMSLISVFSFIGWIAFVSFLYQLTNAYANTLWREILGLPNFIISIWMIMDLVKYSNKVSAPPKTMLAQQ